MTKLKTRKPDAIRVLKINSSSREQGSVTRQLSDSFIDKLTQQGKQVDLSERDVAKITLPFIDESWIGASYTSKDQRTEEQQQRLALSDQLIKELQDADAIVIGVPIYNFSIPAALKAWIDLVARAGVTFRYTETGPVGLLKGKKAYLVLASGGVPVGGEADFASGYMRHVLGFIGIHDVEIIAAERVNIDNDGGLSKAQQQIDRAVSMVQDSNSHAA
jgi:FMN-dependent NADH-azoreductase